MAEKIFDVSGNDATVRAHYLDTFRRSEPLEPEMALLVAILEDAIHCCQKFRGAGDQAGDHQFREAKRWIMDDRDDWLFSFRSVCELLGLDPQFIRRGIVSSTVDSVESGKPRRRPAGRSGGSSTRPAKTASRSVG